MLKFLYNNLNIFVVIVSIGRFKMNLSFLRFGEIQKIMYFLRYHLVLIFRELASTLEELCDYVVDIIP